eukprot:TRINITY_DN48971_c0_g1_i1.p1 TRINITY_DN48971_c0_g1~~TRINITY_DN48971_c0_g1_i1.p1  ORF type:complete len:443 (-),score=65.44 TRINITY_DN48971_c0_g1_i1:188-1516(-)
MAAFALVFVSILVWLPETLCAGVRAASVAKARSSSKTSGETDAQSSSPWVPQFFAPQITPTQFLFISSPQLGKVVYTQLKNFKSLHGRTFALIDSGLEEPCGIAFDRDRGHLYVADRAQKKIFRYFVLLHQSKDRDGLTHYRMETDGIRLTILSGHDVEWVAVTRSGDVFYSDQASKDINKITSETMDMLGTGTVQAEDLLVISEKVQEAQSSSAVAATMNSDADIVTDAPAPQAHILSIYESAINPHVSTPAGIASDGLRLYWANKAEGKTSGSVVQGSVNPISPPVVASGNSPVPFPAKALSNVTDAAYGVAKSASMVLFSCDTGVSGGSVRGVPQSGDEVYEFAVGLSQPRGLVWDGDNTVFAADQGSNTVWSFPIGRLMNNVPITKTVEFTGAFGLALLQEGDIAFTVTQKSGAWFLSPAFTIVLTLFATSFAPSDVW